MEHRLRMCELAFAPLLGVEVSAIEQELGGTSRTLRLIQALAARYPQHQLRLLVGADILLEAPRWQHFDTICELAPLLVAGRGGYSRDQGDGAPILPEVSSEVLRGKLAHGGDISPWVPAKVRAYIDEHALYRAGAT